MSGITYPDWLVRRARTEIKRTGVLSTSLAYELAGAGFDVSALENRINDELADQLTEEFPNEEEDDGEE